jgi:glycosyltransferase involved in cell wall biosynthesis
VTRTRVARVITRLNVGGPAIQAVLLTERLDPDRYDTMLVCGLPGEGEGDMLDLRLSGTVRPHVIVELRRDISPFADLIAFVKLVVLFARFRPTVVHTHLAKAGLLGRVAARLTGAHVVIHTYHGNVLRGYFGAGTSRVFVALERMLGRISTRVVAISPGQKAELESLGIARGDRIVEIPLGFDLEPFRAPPQGVLRAELGIAPATPLVGIVARLVPVKAVDQFIDACAEIQRARPDARFVIVGDGPLRETLEAQTRARGLGEALRFLGWRADLGPIYADLDVLVLTSRNEGTPVSVLEALAVGTPVVATSVGGVPDIVGDDERGVLVPPGQPVAAARAVLELLADDARRADLRAAGPPWVYARHGIAALVRHVDDLYTSLLH